MTTFERAFAIVIGAEGGLSTVTTDPGNWTGGRCGVGRCVGTKYGISAAAYPTLDIAALTLDEAQAIYKRDYWDKVRLDELPPSVALLVFDAAVNNGAERAARWLQGAAGATVDGTVGPQTIQAVQAHAGHGVALLAEFQAQRMAFMAALPTWHTFGLGWARRLCRLPFAAVAMEQGGGS